MSSDLDIILGVGVPVVTGLVGATLLSYQQSRAGIIEAEDRLNVKIDGVDSSAESSKKEMEVRLNDKIDRLEVRLNHSLDKIEKKVDLILEHIVGRYMFVNHDHLQSRPPTPQ